MVRRAARRGTVAYAYTPSLILSTSPRPRQTRAVREEEARASSVGRTYGVWLTLRVLYDGVLGLRLEGQPLQAADADAKEDDRAADDGHRDLEARHVRVLAVEEEAVCMGLQTHLMGITYTREGTWARIHPLL